MIKKVSFVIALVVFSISYSMDEVEDLIDLMRDVKKEIAQKKFNKIVRQKKDNKKNTIAKFSEAPLLVPSAKLVKHKVTYAELIENFSRYKDAKDLNGVILDKEMLLAEAELQVRNWTELSNKTNEVNKSIGFAMFAAVFGMGILLPWFADAQKIFGDHDFYRYLTSIFSGSIALTCAVGSFGYYYEMKNKDLLLYNKIENEKVRDWLKGLS